MLPAERRELIPDVLYLERTLHESSHLESSCPARFTGTGRRLMLPYSQQ
jgi:hypothetical protein